MKIIIHRGTHQIGGVATEIQSTGTRILIDLGEELSLNPNHASIPLIIPGVTNINGHCDAVLFTHYHRDHVGQFSNIREGIPLYIGSFAKELLLETLLHASSEEASKISKFRRLTPGKQLIIGDISITPFSIDHSAVDSYMFLIEADGKRILHTGDFRLHGFRGKAIPQIINKLIGTVDVLITEGTTLNRNNKIPMTEYELQQKVKALLVKYKYVFVLASSTNLERICAISKVTPSGKYFVCDSYQDNLLSLIEKNWGHFSPLYRNIKRTVYGDNLVEKLQNRGFVMMVRDNPYFRNIISQFDPSHSIILYSMWDGYRTKKESTLPEFLSHTGTWENLHTSGHAAIGDIVHLIRMITPKWIIPIHTEQPEALKNLCPDQKVVLLSDGEEWLVE